MLIHGIRPPKNFLIRYLLQNSLAIVVPTEITKRYIEDKFKIEKQNLFVIPSGINPEYFYPKKDVSDLNPPVLCFAGRLEENKGFLEALDCLKKVKKYFPKVRLKVAGEFISKDYKKLVLGFIDRNKLSGNIVFHGYLPPSEMGGLYRSSDLLLFPSKKEAFGRAVVEAMMCGTAAVALEDSGGPETIIENGIDGLLSGQESFAENVIELLKNQDRLRQMSYQAIMNAKRKYSIDKIYLKVESLYLSFLKSGN